VNEYVVFCFGQQLFVKGTAIPLQAWAVSEFCRRLRLPISRKSAHEGGKVVSPTHRPPLPPGNTAGTHFC